MVSGYETFLTKLGYHGIPWVPAYHGIPGYHATLICVDIQDQTHIMSADLSLESQAKFIE